MCVCGCMVDVCMGVWVYGWLMCVQCYQQYRSAYLLLHGLLQQTDHADDKKLLTKCKLSLSVVLRSMHFALA